MHGLAAAACIMLIDAERQINDSADGEATTVNECRGQPPN